MEVAEAAVAAAAVLEAVPVGEVSAEAVQAVDFKEEDILEDVPWVAQGLRWEDITVHRCIDPDPRWAVGGCIPGGVIPAVDVWAV